MEEWKEYQLKDATTVLGDGLHGTPKYDENGTVFFINGNNLVDGKIEIKESTKRVSEDEANKYKKNLNSRTILVSINGTIGNVAKYQGEACILGKSACYFNVSEDFDLNFIYYVVASKQFKNSITHLSTGTTIKNVSLETMRNYSFAAPSINEQKRIAELLSSLDSKIELNRRINDNLEQQAQALFKSWFVDFDPFRGGKFVESELGMIPEGWHIGVPNDIIISTLSGDWGKEKQQGNYTKKVSCIRGADIPYIKMGEKGNMPTRFILEKNYQSKVLTPDDLVIEISGGSPTQSTGRICRISQALLERYNNSIICTNFCKAIKPTLEYSSYLYYLWKMLYKLGIMFSYENGTTGIKNFDINGFAQKERIIIPPKEIVYAFKQIIETFYVKIQTNGIESEQLAKTRDTLLPRLMSGELNTNDLNC